MKDVTDTKNFIIIFQQDLNYINAYGVAIGDEAIKVTTLQYFTKQGDNPFEFCKPLFGGIDGELWFILF